MQVVVGTITDKIVEVTRNAATSKFVGLNVILISGTSSKTGKNVYKIQGTDYVLKPAEVEQFLQMGIIEKNEPNVVSEEQSKTVEQEEETTDSKFIMEDSTDVQPNETGKISYVEHSHGNSDEIDLDSLPDMPPDTTGAGFSEIALDDTDFFDKYPSPSFELEIPKHAGLLDFKERFIMKVNELTDKFGRKTKDAIVENVEKERLKVEE